MTENKEYDSVEIWEKIRKAPGRTEGKKSLKVPSSPSFSTKSVDTMFTSITDAKRKKFPGFDTIKTRLTDNGANEKTFENL